MISTIHRPPYHVGLFLASSLNPGFSLARQRILEISANCTIGAYSIWSTWLLESYSWSYSERLKLYYDLGTSFLSSSMSKSWSQQFGMAQACIWCSLSCERDSQVHWTVRYDVVLLLRTVTSDPMRRVVWWEKLSWPWQNLGVSLRRDLLNSQSTYCELDQSPPLLFQAVLLSKS